MNNSSTKTFSWVSLGVLLASSLYIFLCILHFARGRPLWFDEELVFKSVPTSTISEIFSKPLAAWQMFPKVLFLLMQQLAKPFHFSVWGVRLVSFLSMILAFFVWLTVARRELKKQGWFFIFCLCWAASLPLVYYSAELKQYATDVLAAGLFVAFIQRQEYFSKNLAFPKYLLLLAALPLLGLLSYPAFIFFTFPLWNLFMTRRHFRGSGLALAVYLFSAILVAAFVCHFDVLVSNKAVAKEGYARYFIYFQSPGEFFRTWGEGTVNLFSRWFVEQPRFWKKLSLVFTTFGLLYIPYAFFRNVKQGRRTFDSVETMAFILYAELFTLGALKAYPFSVPRISLFYCPVVFLMTIKALARLKQKQLWAGRILVTLFVAFLMIISAGITREVIAGPLVGGAIQSIWK